MASINVKVPTKKVIASLEKRLAEMKEANKLYEVIQKQYTTNLKEYEAAVNSYVPTGKPTEVTIHHSWRDVRTTEVTVRYRVKTSDLPVRPELDSSNVYSVSTIREVENAIRILKMTEEETVSATTFKAVSQYL